MKITRLASFAAVGFTIACIISVGANVVYKAVVEDERKAMEKKETLIELGDSYTKYSDKLTKAARAYVQFADNSQYEAYKREKSLKVNEPDYFIENLQSVGITQTELEAIKSAIKYQSSLSLLEESAFIKVADNNLEEARVIMFGNEYEIKKKNVSDSIEEFKYILDRESHYEINEARKKADIASTLLTVIQTFNMLWGIGCFVIIYLKLRPINSLLEASQKIVHGNLDVTVKIDSKDEIGDIYRSFGYLVDNIRSVNNLMNEQLEAIINGDFSSRADASKFEGEWKNNIEGLNNVVEAFIKPLNETIDVLDEVTKNNFEIQVVGNYKGDFARIKKKLNSTILSINSYLFEIQRLAVGIQNAGSGIVIRDKDKKITDFNNGAEKILGYQAEDVIGQDNIFAPYVEDTENEDIFDYVLKGKDIQAEVTKMMRKDGTLVFCDLSVTLIINRYGECVGFCSIFQDISDRIKMEEEIKKSIDAALEASRAKSLFLANMSHEIRTPMNGILGLVELTLNNTNVNERARDYLYKMKASANGLMNIINDILDISKIEAGELKLEVIPFDLHQVFSECESINALKAEEKGILLNFYYEEPLERLLLGDPTRLRQALLNIISNAIKFTEKGHVSVKAICAEPVGNRVRIRFEVCDSGIGMTKEQVSNIFQNFKQADESTTRKYGGTGLGLSITKNIIELMGGEIAVESKLGVGTEFHFEIEFELSHEIETSRIANKNSFENLQIPSFNGKILLCEDNEINQMVAADNFALVGLEVTVADNGQIGVEKVREAYADGFIYDLIFMDIHMPVMDGITATQEILQMGYKNPIIAMTANAMKEDRQMCLDTGMTDYLSKPFDVVEIWALLSKYLKQA